MKQGVLIITGGSVCQSVSGRGWSDQEVSVSGRTAPAHPETGSVVQEEVSLGKL